MMTVVTTIIPVFNRVGSIGFAIDSVLKQQLPSEYTLRVVIIDDGSSDDLGSALDAYGDRVTMIRHASNAGPAAARNTGIAAAGPGYVAFLDSDDIWLPGKLAIQIEAMLQHNWAVSCTAYSLIRHDGSEIVSPHFGTGELTIADSVWGCFTGPGSTLVCQREVFDNVGLLDTRLRRLEDWDWQLRLSRRYALGFISEPLSRVAQSSHRDATKVLASLALIWTKHSNSLPGPLRRKFAAAMDIERAAANYRAGRTIAAGVALLRSVIRVPFQNDSLAAVLHNRRSGRQAEGRLLD